MKRSWMIALLWCLCSLLVVNVAPVAASDATDVLDLVNQRRANNGLLPLSLNNALNDAALRHANDMTANNFFDHTGSDCSTPAQRISDAGYLWSRAGENIASGFTSPSAVVDAWWASPGHKANILGDYTHMGLARVGNIWVQTFGKPGSGTGGPASGCTPGGGGTGSSGGSGGNQGATFGGSVIIPPATFADGRINNYDASAPIAVYCLSGGAIAVFDIRLDSSGDEAFRLSAAQIAAGLSQALQTRANVTLATRASTGLYALASGELQAQAPDLREPSKTYKLIMPADICGPLDLGGASAAPPASAPTPTGPSANGGTYTIVAGDTLFSIARRFGVSVTDLAVANNIANPTRIFVGQIIIIPTANTPPSATNPPPTGGRVHIVQRGENLFRIALRYGVPLADLARANNITNPARIFEGQALVIP